VNWVNLHINYIAIDLIRRRKQLLHAGYARALGVKEMDALTLHRDKVIPYRMRAASILTLALRHVERWPNARRMSIHFDDELFIEGLSTGFTNAAIESGIVNCRALLEFLGLQALSPTSLAERSQGGRRGDIGIEDYCLPLVGIAELTAKYNGNADEAELALATLITAANKWLAHNTTAVEMDAQQIHLLEIASRGVPALIISYFYTRLGLPAPDYELTARTRNSDA